MNVKIENLTNRPVLLRLNSGQSLHLSPRITSAEILDVEVRNNAKVKKLQNRHIIALHVAKKRVQPSVAPKPKKEKAESTKGKK